MQQLLGDNQLEPSIMKQSFLQRLPTNAQLILASTKDDLDIESLAKLVDTILEVDPTHPTKPTLSTVSPLSEFKASPQTTDLRELRELVSQLQLTTTINNFSLNFNSLGTAITRDAAAARTPVVPPYHPATTTRPVILLNPPLALLHVGAIPNLAPLKKGSPPCSFLQQPSP